MSLHLMREVWGEGFAWASMGCGEPAEMSIWVSGYRHWVQLGTAGYRHSSSRETEEEMDGERCVGRTSLWGAALSDTFIPFLSSQGGLQGVTEGCCTCGQL